MKEDHLMNWPILCVALEVGDSPSLYPALKLLQVLARRLAGRGLIPVKLTDREPVVSDVPDTVFCIKMTHMDGNQLALQIGQQYCDLLDNHRDQLSLYLSDDVILQWFGRTIRGKDLVTSFFNREIANTTHKLTNVEPADPIHIQSICRKEVSSYSKPFQDSGSPQEKYIKSFRNLTVNDCMSSSGCDAGNLAFSGDITMQQHDSASGGDESEQCCINKCFKASGEIQFCRTRMTPSSHKNLKLAADTMKWERSCKMHISYSFFQSQGEFRNFKLEQIIYEDSTRCKRNLAPEFEKIAQ